MKMKFFAILATMLIMTGSAWADSLKINGSTTVLPIAQKAAEAYMEANKGVAISISGGGSGNGIKALIDGATDIAMSSRFLKDKEVAEAMQKGQYPVPFAVAYDCIVPVVHPSNPVTDLTLDQLKAIYMGEVKNWKQVGGPDMPIAVVSRDTSSGTYEVWEELVLKKERVTPAAQLQASNGAVAQAVSKNKFALGYVGFAYLNKDLKAVTISGIEGTPETAKSGVYPVSRALFMFTNGWPTGNTMRFLQFLMDPAKGQQIVREAGFVPLN